ncbi:hypothetical protein BGZ99_004903 [Dissophora globulifera]|uniref:Uncharacterized protein n=1 Tax=Dissophora globulifera TaxID=979702 RepID=A0A9P6RWW2_9FUNG|nr:hypothetical protein BGZ99_004903 [Dissophora globulifera]
MSKKHRDRKTGASTSATTAVATAVAGEMTPVTAFSTRRTSLLDMPTLREMYDVTVQTRDQPLTQAGGRGNGGTRTKRRGSGSGPGLGPSAVSLGSLYLDYTGPLLRQFVDSWVKSVSQPGGYGNVVGKRNAGNVEMPTLQQWMAGCLGVCEALGLGSLATPQLTVVASDNKDIGRNNNNNNNNNSNNNSSIIDDTNVDRTEQEPQRSSEDHTAAMTTKLSKLSVAGVGAGSGQGRRSGNGKRYSQRCANIVQKKVLDYVLTDDVMEELYGQKPDLAATTTATTTRAHSERYHQLKAEQASKLFQTLAHRR